MSQPTIFDLERYPLPPARPRRRPGRIIAIVVVLALLGAAALWAVANRQFITDQLVVWNYTSSDDIDGYIERSTMTERGEFLFKASEPAIVAGEEFNEVCGSGEAGTGILGCYLPRTKTISLYDVTDDRLDGIEDVVASHEMLHAAWDRMSPEEQAAVEPLLEAEAAALAGDAEFVARMDLYDRTEPGERDNELHSIIGTEYATISPELESYYTDFFDDRAALVALHVTSNAVFVDLEAKSAALVAELDALRTGIETDYASYNSGYDQLNSDIIDFNADANGGAFTSNAQFTRAKNALMARRDELDALYTSIQERSDVFDSKAAELESLNAEASELNTNLNIVPRDEQGLE
jgi:hypothetical protein